MNAAQVALAVLGAVMIVAGTALVITDHGVWGSILLGVGIFGFLAHLGMVVNDSAARRGRR